MANLCGTLDEDDDNNAGSAITGLANEEYDLSMDSYGVEGVLEIADNDSTVGESDEHLQYVEVASNEGSVHHDE